MNIVWKTFLAFAFLPHISWANEKTTTLDVQQSISYEVNQIIKQFDDYAFAIVKVTPVIEKLDIPASPISISSIKLSDEKGLIQLTAVEVQVYSQFDKIPPSLEELISSAVKIYGVEPKIEAKLLDIAQLNQKDFIKKSPPAETSWVAFGFTLILLVGGFLAYVFTRRNHSPAAQSKTDSSIKEAFENGLGQVSSAIQGIGQQMKSQVQNSSANNSEFEQLQEVKRIHELSTPAILSLLSDCYWCHLDRYASFLWSSFSSDQKKYVLENTILKNYILGISTLPQEKQTYHRDAYYQECFDFSKINQMDLVTLVKKNPLVYKYLSPLRKNFLEISPVEKIKLETLTPGKLDVVSIQNISSLPRSVKPPVQIRIQRIEDEEELLKVTDIPVEYVAAIPSLIWIKQIPSEQAKSILQNYSAQELAEAWIAPNEILDYCKTLLPPKKVGLLESYKEKNTPHRASITFLAIHEQVSKILIANEESSESRQSAA